MLLKYYLKRVSLILTALLLFSSCRVAGGPTTTTVVHGGTRAPGSTSCPTAPACLGLNSGCVYGPGPLDAQGCLTSCGSVVCTATKHAPVITSQPSNLTVVGGADATFSVVATGNGPISYQWYKDKVAISGQTSASLIIKKAQSSDVGDYGVGVSDSSGTVTSLVAHLTVSVAPVTPSATPVPQIPTPPTITAQPGSVTANVGSQIILSITATGSGTLTYQWMKSRTPVGGNSAQFNIPNAQVSDSGTYSVIVTNSLGTATSDQATVTVTPLPMAPQITTGPGPVAQSVGTSLNLTVTAIGTLPLAFQWYKDNAPISGATGQTFSLDSLKIKNSGSYTVVISNSVGSITSHPALVTVTDPSPTVVVPQISANPSSATQLPGAPIKLSVTATGTIPLEYQWYKGTQVISGATDPIYVIDSLNSNNVGSYTVVVKNSAGSVTSSIATVSMTTPKTKPTSSPLPLVAPVIKTQPQSTSINAGGTAKFSVYMGGYGSYDFSWSKDGTVISGANKPQLTVQNVSTANAGVYTVLVSNSSGSVKSSGATLTVLPAIVAPPVAPTITTQPGGNAAFCNQSTSITAEVSGTAPISIRWYKDGTALTDTPTLGGTPLTASHDIVSGSTATTLTLSSLTSDSTGNYSMVASNSAGSVTSSNANIGVVCFVQSQSLTVGAGGQASFYLQSVSHNPPLLAQWSKDGVALPNATQSIPAGENHSFAALTINDVQSKDAGTYLLKLSYNGVLIPIPSFTLTVNPLAPKISQQPISTVTTIGKRLNLSVTTSGTQPMTYQWFKDGKVIKDEKDSSLVISSLSPSDLGSYSVAITNSVGTTSSASAVVRFSPGITSQPKLPAALMAGQKMTLSVGADGSAPLSYQWTKDGVNISGATGPSFEVASVSTLNVGVYAVVVTNPFGTATSQSVALALGTAPIITAQPQSYTGQGGDNFLFVTATGTGNLSYQWQKNGVNIQNATYSSFRFDGTASDSGEYDVIVTDNVGSVVSATARVKIMPPVNILVQPQSMSAYQNSNFDFSVSAIGSSSLGYYWGFAPTSGGPAIDLNNLCPNAECSWPSSRFPFPATLSPTNLTYIAQVRVCDSYSCTLSAPAKLTLIPSPKIVAQPQSLSLSPGKKASFSVQATIDDPTVSLSYQWHFNGAPISGATQSTYEFTVDANSKSGKYSVSVATANDSKNSAMSNPASFELLYQLPVITSQPDRVLYPLTGSAVNLAINANGFGDSLTYAWTKNGKIIGSGANLSIPSVSASDSGEYAFSVTNRLGTTTGNSILMLVTAPDSALQKLPDLNLVLESGSSTKITPSPFTFSDPAFVRTNWTFNNQPLPNAKYGRPDAASPVWVPGDLVYLGGSSFTCRGQPCESNGLMGPSGVYYDPIFNASTYFLWSLGDPSAGTYTVVRRGANDYVTQNINVSVVPPLGIVQPPEDSTLPAGSPATFQIGLTGAGPFTVFWIKDDLVLFTDAQIQRASPTTTSSFTIPNVDQTSEGNYWAYVTTPTGSVQSGKFAIKVTGTSSNVQVPLAGISQKNNSRGYRVLRVNGMNLWRGQNQYLGALRLPGGAQIYSGTNTACGQILGTLQCWSLDDLYRGWSNKKQSGFLPVSLTTGNLVDMLFLNSATLGDVGCGLFDDGSIKCWVGLNLAVIGQMALAAPIVVAAAGASDIQPGLILDAQSGGAVPALCALMGDALKCTSVDHLNSGRGAWDKTLFASGVQSFSTDLDHGCAIVNNQVKCWGSNSLGQLGNGTRTDSWDPVSVSLGSVRPTSLATWAERSCVIEAPEKGGMYCWGSGALTPIKLISSKVIGLTAGTISSGPCAETANGFQCWTGLTDQAGPQVLDYAPAIQVALNMATTYSSTSSVTFQGTTHTVTPISSGGGIPLWSGTTYVNGTLPPEVLKDQIGTTLIALNDKLYMFALSTHGGNDSGLPVMVRIFQNGKWGNWSSFPGSLVGLIATVANGKIYLSGLSNRNTGPNTSTTIPWYTPFDTPSWVMAQPYWLPFAVPTDSRYL